MTLTNRPARTSVLRAGLAAFNGVRAHLPLGMQRRAVDLAMGFGGLPAGMTSWITSLGGVRGQWLRPADASPGAMLYLHGGAFVTGSPRSHRRVAARIAEQVRLPVFVPEYRLAPEHPFPAAIADIGAVYDALLASGVPAQSVLLVGDSAGGGLALSLVQKLRDAERPLPSGVGLLCPWLDLAPDHAGTRPAVPHDPLNLTALLRESADDYLAGTRADDSVVSPLRGNLDGLPPIVAICASDDPLHIDAERLAERCVGVELHRIEDAWHGFYMHDNVVPMARQALDLLGRRLAAQLPTLRVGIVGAGMSGLCMAARLRDAGYKDIVIYEKADEVGGTWRENRYPGLTCDVPSRFYSYSFAPNPSWSRLMSPGGEILEYFKRFADDHDLRRFIRFRCKVVAARWTESRWKVTFDDGRQDDVDVLVTAAGFLHHPVLPDIGGRDSFAGTAVHSARWDSSIQLAGKRVGVIGTGSTGVQLATAMSESAAHLSLFQRTPQWVLWLPNHCYRPATQMAYARLRWLNHVAYRGYRWVMEGLLGVAAVRPGWQRRALSAYARASLRFSVTDPELRRKLTPDYPPLCKRIVVSGGFYRAMQRDNVELVTEGIERIEPRGVVTTDGTLHELDVLVFATGFDARAFMRPMTIEGTEGRTLEDSWTDGPYAYRTIALPGFPNFFMLIGPHSPVGNQSIIGVAETQTRYIMRWIERLSRAGNAAASPRPEATAAYNDQRRAAAPQTIAAGGCTSWYLGPDGTPEIWPWTPNEHRAMLRDPALDEWIIEKVERHAIVEADGTVRQSASTS